MAESQPVSRKRESSGDSPEIVNAVIKGTPTPKNKERLLYFLGDPQGAQGPIDDIDSSFHSALSRSCSTSSSASISDSDDEYVPEEIRKAKIRKAKSENANQKEDKLEKDVQQSSNRQEGQENMYYAASTINKGCNAHVDSSDEFLLQYNSEEEVLEEGTSQYDEQYLLDSTLDEMDNVADRRRGVRTTKDQNEGSNQQVQVFECEDVFEVEEEPTTTTIPEQKQRRRFKRVHPAKKIKFNMRQEIRVLRDEVRPVLFRKQSESLMTTSNQKVRRNRVTRKIARHPIQQFHLADSKTELEDVEVLTLAETVENYLNASKAFLPSSENMFDQILCAAVEYGGTVKMFHFGKDMKKNSCKQKKLRFQLSWWKKIKSQEKDKTGHLRIAEEPQLRIEDDKFLYAQHFMTPRHQRSQMQCILWRLRRRNLERRQNNDIIRDSSFFCREFFLVKSAISLRIKMACDIPECFIPPMMKCGYFPACAKHDHQKMDYLKSRFEEAQMEYLSLNYLDIKPLKGFRAGEVSSHELWEFHRTGRHIHGFFLIWEDEVNYFNDNNGRFRKRYLVDMFNFIRFPLYVAWERWDSRLRSAFDRVILYNLHLAEVLRANRPVFDTLSRNPSLLQPLTLQESAMLMLDHEVHPRYFTNVVGKQQFYEWAWRNSNMEHLSAFMMIVGGTKELHEIKDYEFPRSHVYNRDAMECGMLNKDGKAYQFNSHVPIKKVFIDDNLGDEGVRLVDMQTPYTEKVKTRLIVDIPQPQPPPPKQPSKKNTRSFMTTFTRKKLMQVRKKIYGVQYSKSSAPSLTEPSKKGRKKPGRKPKTKMEGMLEKNDFDSMMQASDLESDYEGFQGSEEIMDFEPTSKTFLKRSTSSDSIFLDYTYKECLTNRICLLHQRKFLREIEKTKQRKYRKMNRIVMKHLMRHRINASEELNNKKEIEIYHRKMPITAKHAEKTKVAMRYPSKFRKYNLPQVYEKGETNLVLEVYDVCAYLVNHVCEQEITSSRTANELSEMFYKARTIRRAFLDEMSTVGMSQLPPPEYLAMEILTNKRMTGSPSIITAKRKIMDEMAKVTENHLDNFDPRRRYLDKDTEQYETSSLHRKMHKKEKPKEPSVLRISEVNNEVEKERLERIGRNCIAKEKIEKKQIEREAISRKENLPKEHAERIARENMSKEVEAERRAKETEENRQLEVQPQLELNRVRDDALEAYKSGKAEDERRSLSEHLPDHDTVFFNEEQPQTLVVLEDRFASLQVKSTSHQERSKIHKELDYLLKSSSLTNFQKVSWSFGVLTVICSLLCADFPSEHSQSGRLKNESLFQKDNCHLKVILKKLVFASQILSEACSNKSDGILLVKNAVSSVLRNLAVIALELNTSDIFKPNLEPHSIFCELIRDVFVELRAFLETEYQITEQQLAQLEHESNIVRDSIVQSNNFDLYLKRMFDGEQVFRIISIIKWFTAIKMEHGEDIDRIIQETYRCFNLKLSGQDWRMSEIITQLACDEENVKPNIIDIDNEDDIVAEYDSQGNEINVIGNTETFNKNFAKTNASVKVPTKMERKLLKKTARAKRKAEEELEISLPSKLPKYDVTFVDKVWKSIERTFGELSGREKQQISLYDKFGRGHKRGALRFHMLLSVQPTNEPNSLPEKKRLSFVPFRVEEGEGPRLEAENNLLAQFECPALSEEEFNKMMWHVNCNGGGSKVALEFFTELTKLKNVKSFKKSVSNGTVDLKFKVYKHLWFMGSTLPCQLSPGSHEDNTEYNACAGCTNGDVIIVHNCTCEFHNDSHKKTTIYAYSIRPLGPYMITRLVGRFVCEHGPSSVLQLDSEPPTAERFIRRGAEYEKFPAKLRVFNKRTMFDELCETFMDSQTTFKNPRNSSSGSNIDMVIDTFSECSDESTSSTSFANTDEEISKDNKSSSGEDDNSQVPGTVHDGGEYPNLNSEEEKYKTPESDDPIPHTTSEILIVAKSEPITMDSEYETFPTVFPEILPKLDDVLSLPTQSSKQVDSPICPFNEVVGPIENPVLFGNSRDIQKTNLSKSNLHEDVPRRKQYRNFQLRSKSVDPDENGRVNQASALKRAASACDFDFIQSYAERKIDFITEKYRKDHVHEYFDLGAFPLDNKNKEEMQELPNLLKGLTHLGYRESEEVFISLVAIHYRNKTQKVNSCNKELDRIRRSTEKLHLNKYRGTDINSDMFPEFQNDKMVYGESISIVMDEYYKFEQFKKDVMFDASIALGVISGMRTEYLKAFPMLFTAYEMVLSFNRSLLEHMLYLVAKHVFNPYAVFEAESEQNLERIRQRLNNVKSAMSMVKNAFFNLEPLRRQADELKEIQKRVPPNEMKLVVASLAKLVIERVRAPQTVDVVLGKFGSWLNSSKDFKETVNLLMFSIKDTLPEASVCNRMLSEAEEMCFEPDLVDSQCRMFSHDYALPIPEFFRAVFWQSEVFLRCLDSCSLSGSIDPYMRSYYGHKSFLRMYNLIQRKTFLTREDVIAVPHTTNAMVFSIICGTEKRNYDLMFDANNLNNYYERLLQYPTTQYLIEPSHIGVVFCCFDNIFFVAAVNEKPVNVLPNYKFPNTSCIRAGEISFDVEYPSCKITLMLNRQTLMLSVVFLTVEGVGKDDRLELDVLPVSMVHEDRGEFAVDWQLVVETYISQGYNLLRYIMGPRKIGNTSILKANKNEVSRRHKLVANLLQKRKLAKSIRKRRKSRPVDICDNGKKARLDDCC